MKSPQRKIATKRLTEIYAKYYPGGNTDHPLAKRLKEGLSTLVQRMAERPRQTQEEYGDLVIMFLKPNGAFFQKDYADLLSDAHAIVRRRQNLDPLERIGSLVPSQPHQKSNKK